MKVVKVVDTDKKYVSKNGKEYTKANFYLVLDNGTWISIRPSFARGYSQLDVLCEEVVKNGKQN